MKAMMKHVDGPLLPKAEEYRRKAAGCRSQAAGTLDPQAKTICEDMARSWDEIAAQVERLGW